MPLQVALIVVVPVASEVTSSLEPAVLLIVATDCDDELQLTKVVSTCVVLSENVPVAVNCSVVPGAMLGFAGVTAIERSVAEEVPDPPLLEPPLLQFVTSKRIRTRKSSLFNFFDAHSLWYQGRHIGAALQVPHMSPFLYNDTVCFHLDVPAARLPLGMIHGLLIFISIGSKERRQIGVGQSVPCDTEYDA